MQVRLPAGPFPRASSVFAEIMSGRDGLARQRWFGFCLLVVAGRTAPSAPNGPPMRYLGER